MPERLPWMKTDPYTGRFRNRCISTERLPAARDYALGRMGERTLRSTMAGLLGLAVYEQGRYEEAEDLSRVGEESSADGDRESQALWRRVRAKALGRGGAFEPAETLAREAVDLTAETDALVMRGDALMDLAEVLHLADRSEEAAVIAAEALALYQKKGNVAAAARAERAPGEPLVKR